MCSVIIADLFIPFCIQMFSFYFYINASFFFQISPSYIIHKFFLEDKTFEITDQNNASNIS